MCDTLTAEERAAIAAFPPERVQRIPRGTVALGHAEYVYDPSYPGDGLRPVTPYDWKRRATAEVAKARRERREREASTKGREKRLLKANRQERVRDMTLARCTVVAIAAALNVCTKTVTKDRRALVESGELPAGMVGRKKA